MLTQRISSRLISLSTSCLRWSTKYVIVRHDIGSSASWRYGSLITGCKKWGRLLRPAPSLFELFLNKNLLRFVYEAQDRSDSWLTFVWVPRPICDDPARSHRRCVAHSLGTQATHVPDDVWHRLGDRFHCSDGCRGRRSPKRSGGTK